MGSSTTIAINKKVYNRLLQFVHFIESDKKKRVSMSDAIEYLLEYVEKKI